jgi:hypothetical protein
MPIPGASSGTMRTEIPLCLGTSGLVRQASHSWVQYSAPVFQILVPLITQASPSSAAVVRRAARSLPASGSE